MPFFSDKKPGLGEGGRVIVDQRITDKATIISQHILQLVSGVPTPLGIATAYHVYNQTRSKSLITLNNRLGMGISYERLHRQLTAQSEKVMQQVATDGVYVPDTMSKNCTIPHVFAMDNLDWKKNTLEGGSFNATTAIINENQEMERVIEGVRVPTSTFYKRKTLSDVATPTTSRCFMSAKDRQRSRSLENIIL